MSDSITGTALSFGEITGVQKITEAGATTDIKSGVATNTTAAGFNMIIPTMENGDKVRITYTANVDYAKITGSGTAAQTGNTVTVKSNEDPTPDESSADFSNRISYVSVQKGSSVASAAVDGKKKVTYIGW